jgi:short-subunit dehydrogenase
MSKRSAVALSGAVALVTGASRGLGPVLAEALLARGARLVLAARNARELEAVAQRLRARGGQVLALPTDLADRAQLARLAARAELEMGQIDVLVNNAALEQIAFFEQLSEAETDHYLTVNLTAPIQLTRLVLPGMLARGRGHIVNIASIAGFGAAAFGETYGATKSGLIGFTRSLRASLKTVDSPVSASVVCPGFVADAGMYADLHAAHAVRPPAILGTCRPEEVAQGLLRALDRDEPEVIVNRGPLRVMLAIGMLFPRLFERLTLQLGINGMFLKAAESDRAEREAKSARVQPTAAQLSEED